MSNENHVLLVEQAGKAFAVPINSFVKYMTEEEYAALSPEEQENGNTYLVDGDPLLVVQETGTSMRDVMSQDAVTRELQKLQEQIDAIKSCSCTPSTSNPNPDPPVNPPPADPPTIPPPTGLAVSNIGSDSVTLNWTVPTGIVIASHTARISLNGTTWSNLAVGGVTDSAQRIEFTGLSTGVIRGLVPDTVYYFSVIVNTFTDQSRPSSTLIARTAP